MPHVQIRNVPPKLHRLMKMRAAAAGMSLSEYLLAELEELGEKPTTEELIERVRRRKLVPLEPSAAEIIREHRGV